MTVLLAVAVFLTIIQDSLPEASEPSVSLLAYKLLVDVLLGALITSSAIFGSAIYHRNENDQISASILCFVRFFKCKKTCCRKSPKVIDVQRVAEKTPPPEDADIDLENDVITWRELGKFFDKCCFLFFTMCLVINNVVLMVIISIN